jgi:hypothetical protein
MDEALKGVGEKAGRIDASVKVGDEGDAHEKAAGKQP